MSGETSGSSRKLLSPKAVGIILVGILAADWGAGLYTGTQYTDHDAAVDVRGLGLHHVKPVTKSNFMTSLKGCGLGQTVKYEIHATTADGKAEDLTMCKGLVGRPSLHLEQ